jgi:anti-anti-sigma regulatory factor
LLHGHYTAVPLPGFLDRMTMSSSAAELSVSFVSPQTFELRRALDAGSVDHIRQHVKRSVIAPPLLRLDCRQVQVVEPVGAALLWLFCREMQRDFGTQVRLTGLSQFLAQKLRSHPLHDYFRTGEEIFEDPFGTPLPSQR